MLPPQTIRELLAGGLLSILVSGCGLLEKAQRYNALYDARGELALIEQKIAEEELSETPIYTLYPYDERGNYTTQLTQLIAKLGTREEKIKVAYYTGDLLLLQRVMGTPATSKDSLWLANAHLILGNWREAEWLNRGDLATEAGISLARGDTLKAQKELQTILLAKGKSSEKGIKLRAGRALLQITPQPTEEQYRTVARLSPLPWERFMLLALAGERTYRSTTEQAFVTYLQALEDTAQLSKATQLLLAEADTPWREKALLTLRPLLVQHSFFPQALDVHDALHPGVTKEQYPYTLLPEYREEIELLRTYERQEKQKTEETPQKTTATPQPNSFREKYGNVPKVFNWAMVINYTLTSSSKPAIVLNDHASYQAIKKHLQQLFTPPAKEANLLPPP